MDRNKLSLGNAILTLAELAVGSIMCAACFKAVADETKIMIREKKQKKALKKSVKEAMEEESAEEEI